LYHIGFYVPIVIGKQKLGVDLYNAFFSLTLGLTMIRYFFFLLSMPFLPLLITMVLFFMLTYVLMGSMTEEEYYEHIQSN